MTMPIDLVLVRHGESEGNAANKRSRSGDDQHFSDAFKGRHSSSWRLTDLGREQARQAGVWIRERLDIEAFDRAYVSEYVRAQETAARLELPGLRWYVESYLRERDWGDLDVMTHAERMARFEESLKRRKVQSFYWIPPNGESLATMTLRIDRALNTLHRECSDKRVIMVLHGEIMWGFRVRLERMSQQRFLELDSSKDSRNFIHNCQILHYTRRDPETRKLTRAYNWVRSICPWEPTRSRNSWEPIVRRAFTNEELMQLVEQTPRMVSS